MRSVHIDTARGWRGGQNQVLLTVLGLRALNHRTVLVADPQGELRRRTAEGFDVLPIATTGEMSLSAGWRLARELRTIQPDIVHAHDPHGVAMAALALSLGTLPNRPRLVASRRVDFHLKRNAFSRWKYRAVDRFICASRAIQDMLVADGIPARSTVLVHEGIDLVHIDAAPVLEIHQALWLPAHVPIVGNVAALVPHKGQRHLVEAAALVLREMPDVHFVILGDGELRESLERQVKHLGLEKHVLLLGFQPNVLSYIKGFDIFAMTSLTEGLGTSVLDAMACRRPVVATRAGGIPEIVTAETARLVDPRDDEGLAREILALLRDPAGRDRMGTAGRAHVEAHFTAERMVDETLAVYEDLLDGTRREGDTVNRAADA